MDFSVTLVWAAGMSCPPEMVASIFGGQEKSKHHLLSEQVCTLAHKLSGWCNMLMMVLGLLVCPALGQAPRAQPLWGARSSCFLCLAHKEAVQMASRGIAFAHSVTA